MESYDKFQAEYNSNNLKYWETIANKLVWTKQWDEIYSKNNDSNAAIPKWFSGGETSLCYNILDKKVEDGFGNDVAVIFDSPYTKTVKQITYNDLLNKVSQLAGAFAQHGLKTGDRVLIFMPMIPETLYCMLACNRMGLVYSILQGRFGHKVIVEKCEDFKPNATIVANGEFNNEGIVYCKDLLDTAFSEIAIKPAVNFVLQRPQITPAKLNHTLDVDFELALNAATPHNCVSMEANSPVFVLYTSGTTGKPKGVVHTVTSVAMAMLQDSGEICKSHGGDILFWNTSYVWIIGQIYLGYYPLFWKIPFVLYEGTTFNIIASEIYRIMSTYAITSASFSVPAMRCIKMQDPDGRVAKRYEPLRIRKLFVSSSPADETTLKWAKQIFGVPVYQHYGATETGGAIAVTCIGANTKRYSKEIPVGKPLPGWDVRVLNDNGIEAKPNQIGRLVLKCPLHPMNMYSLYQNDQLFYETYLQKYPGYFDMKDNGKMDEDKNLYVTGRADADFKVQGHRISCSSIEDAILKHPDVAECVVVTRIRKGINEVNNEIPEIFYICKNDVQSSPSTISIELIDIVQKEIGSFLQLNMPMKVDQLPRTITGKLARGAIQNLLRSSGPENVKSEFTTEQDITSLSEAIKLIYHQSG